MLNDEVIKAGGTIQAVGNLNMAIFEYKNLEDYIENAQACPYLRVDESGKSEQTRKGFYGSIDFEDGLDVVRHGLDIDHETIHLQEFKQFASQSIEAVADVVGGEVLIGNYLEGIPENMIDFRPVDNPKFIDVLVAVAELADISSVQMNNKAAGTAYLVDKLENEGYRVRLRAFVSSQRIGDDSQDSETVLVTIKDHQEVLSVGQLSGACSAAFFRRVGFRHRERFFNGTDVTIGVSNEFNVVEKVFPLLFNPGTEFIFLPSIRIMKSTSKKQFNLKTTGDAIAWAEYYSNHKITI